MNDETEFTPEGIRHYLATHGTVTVTFTKKNGEERIMVCTTNPLSIPWEHQPKKDSKKREFAEDHIVVFDLEVQAWRSFKADSVTSIE